MIKSIRHKGLKKFFNSGGKDTQGINTDHEYKLRDQLAALDSATDIADMGSVVNPVRRSFRRV